VPSLLLILVILQVRTTPSSYLQTIGKDTPGAIKFTSSNSEYTERSVALLYFSWRVFICWDCLQSSSHHVVRTRWGLYHFL